MRQLVYEELLSGLAERPESTSGGCWERMPLSLRDTQLGYAKRRGELIRDNLRGKTGNAHLVIPRRQAPSLSGSPY